MFSIDIFADGIGRRPSVPMVALEQRGSLDQFFGVFDWHLGRIHKAV